MGRKTRKLSVSLENETLFIEGKRNFKAPLELITGNTFKAMGLFQKYEKDSFKIKE